MMATSSGHNFSDKPKTEISFRDILEFAPIGFMIFQRDWRIKYVNKNFFFFKCVFDSAPSNVIGKNLLEQKIFSGIDISEDLKLLSEGVAFEKETCREKTLERKEISVLIKGSPIIIDGEYTGGMIILEDIKTEIPVRDELPEYSEPFRNFLQKIAHFFFISDISGNIKYIPSQLSSPFDSLFEYNLEKPGNYPQKLSSEIFGNDLSSVFSLPGNLEKEINFGEAPAVHTLKVTLIPFGEDEKNPVLCIGIVNDVTDEKIIEREKAAEQTELRKFEEITLNILDAVIGLDAQGNINMWNQNAAKIFGYTKSEVFGKFIGRIITSVDEAYFENLKKDLLKTKLWESQFKLGEQGSPNEFISIRMALIGSGDNAAIILLCTNITERARIEHQLRSSEARFRDIITNTHEFICTMDLYGQITYANPYFLNEFSYSKEEIEKLNFMDLIDPAFLKEYDFKFSNIGPQQVQSIELPLITKHNKKIHVFASFTTSYDLNNIPQYFNAIITDITLKKEAEKDLLLIRSVFEASQDGIALLHGKKFILINDSFVKMLGYKSASEMLGTDPLDYVIEQDMERVAHMIEAWEKNMNPASRFDFTGRRKDGSVLFVENSVSSYQIENEIFVVWVLRDVTDEKNAQLALQISEERYRNITENINESFWTAERVTGRLKAVFYTSAIKKITGYPSEKFIEDPKLWRKIIHPDDEEIVVDKIKKFYSDKSRNFYSLEYRILDNLGNTIWIENKLSVLRENGGEIQKVFGIVSDITLNRRAEEELRKSAENLKELNETKDRFISIVSHDLRTPFSSILGFTDILLSEDDMPQDKQKKYIEFIQESSRNMLSLVNSLLDWTRLQTGRVRFEPERINMKPLVEKAFSILAGVALQKNIKLISAIEKDIFVHADESLLLQVFNNLMSNAIKFTKAGGTISVNATPEIEKRQIVIGVKDDGVGIRKEDIDKLFKVDSKFTTNGTAGERGSGLGLSLVHDIIQKHGGRIWVESEFGKGSEFIFTLPISSTKVLLVDDIKTDRILYSKLFKSLIPNYDIIEAANGKEALDIIKQQSPALVVTDHKMPVMSGYDLVKQINVSDIKVKPPVIVLSSDITVSIAREYKEMGVEFIFEKPVNLATFKTAIEKSLKKAVYVS